MQFFLKKTILPVCQECCSCLQSWEKNYLDMSFVAMLIVTAHDQLERSCFSEIVFTVDQESRSLRLLEYLIQTG